MPEKITAFFKKYSFIFLIIILLFIFKILTRSPEVAARSIPVSHSLIIESHPETSETETVPESEPQETESETETTEPPESVMIEDVPYYSQAGLLPTGCEIVSAKMLLEYYTKQEIDIHKIIDLLDCQYPEDVDGVTCAPHPEDAFIGIPEESSGFGCFAPIIVKALNQLLPKEYKAVDISGFDLQEIAETYLPQGKPVLVWATIYLWEPHEYLGWYLVDDKGKPTDEWYDWLANEHCMVLVGYDADYYYFNDPYDSNGLISFSREKTEKRFAQIGKYAAVVTEK
ncbi:MAG: C39 family peptidase [Oscillospiraceae bacterium]|nr:C39 family peptidase [Oscillospiraceae bacterium]